MNADLFTRWLQVEAEILFEHHTTPEFFVSRAKPMLEELIRLHKSEKLKEEDLQKILVETQELKNPGIVKENSYFDIVDLSLYRAN